MERYIDLTEIREADQVNFAASYLKNCAASWWMVEYKCAETASLDIRWEDFVHRLRHRFKPANADESARERLSRLKQIGSVAEYSHRFRIIMQDLPDMHERD